jgi:peptidyl-prolyl cis-trans isomerase D
MLESFRKNQRGVALAIVIVISAIFAFSGTGSIFLSSTGNEAVLVVNGEKISQWQLQQVLSQEKYRVTRENPDVDTATLDSIIRPQVIQQLIRRELFVQAAEAQGLAALPTSIAEILSGVENFQSDGRFDRDKFLYAIRNQGHTQATLIDSVKEDLLIQQYAGGLMNSSFVTSSELDYLAGVIEQERDFRYFRLPLQPIKEAVENSEQEIIDHFEQSKANYQTDVQVSIEYIELNASMLQDSKTITDEQIEARFKQELESLDRVPSRRAAHILLTKANEKLLSEVQSRLDTGADFADLAEQYSEDFSTAKIGGDLGYTTGDVFPKAFETALAKLEVGEISDPIMTDEGIHFIKLLDIQEQDFEFSKERNRIKQALLKESTENLLLEKLEVLKEMSFNAETLTDVAEDLNLQVRTSTPFTRRGGDDIAAFPQVVKAAYSVDVLEDKYASDVLELGDDRYVVIKLNEHFKSRQKQLHEVYEEVGHSLTLSKARKILEDQSASLLADINTGKTIEEVAEKAGINWQEKLGVKRSSTSVDREILSHAFGMPKDHTVSDSFYTHNGDFVSVTLLKVTVGDKDTLGNAQKLALRELVQSTINNREIQSFEASLVAQAEIVQ